jgi:hypothetical protein
VAQGRARRSAHEGRQGPLLWKGVLLLHHAHHPHHRWNRGGVLPYVCGPFSHSFSLFFEEELTSSTCRCFAVWVKPPDVSFGGVEDPSTGSIVSVASGGFNLNFRLKARRSLLLIPLLPTLTLFTSTDRRHQPQLSVPLTYPPFVL